METATREAIEHAWAIRQQDAHPDTEVFQPTATLATLHFADRSNEVNELVLALSKSQGEFPEVTKKRTANAGSYSYDYADLADVMLCVRPALSKNELAIYHQLAGSTLKTTLCHSSGQWIHTLADVQVGQPQVLGSSLTYMRRYSVLMLCGIFPRGEDDDGQRAQDDAADGRKPKPGKIPAKFAQSVARDVENKTLSEVQRSVLRAAAHKRAEELLDVAIAGGISLPGEDPAETLTRSIATTARGVLRLRPEEVWDLHVPALVEAILRCDLDTESGAVVMPGDVELPDPPVQERRATGQPGGSAGDPADTSEADSAAAESDVEPPRAISDCGECYSGWTKPPLKGGGVRHGSEPCDVCELGRVAANPALAF